MKTILAIDDEFAITEAIVMLLNDAGYHAEAARGGREGLEKIAELHPDLVLLDIMMPDMDGREVYRHMQADAEMRNTPVIMMSAALLKSGEVEAPYFLAKPFSLAKLVGLVGELIGRPDGHERPGHGQP
jgi:two-component system, sensor histidine kinase and response regulator